MVYKPGVEAQTSSSPQVWAGKGTGLVQRESWPRSHPNPLEEPFQTNGSFGLLQDFYHVVWLVKARITHNGRRGESKRNSLQEEGVQTA